MPYLSVITTFMVFVRDYEPLLWAFVREIVRRRIVVPREVDSVDSADGGMSLRETICEWTIIRIISDPDTTIGEKTERMANEFTISKADEDPHLIEKVAIGFFVENPHRIREVNESVMSSSKTKFIRFPPTGRITPIPETCSVCLCSCVEGERTQTPCGHAFHVACIAPWIAFKQNCPACRTKFVLVPIFEEE